MAEALQAEVMLQPDDLSGWTLNQLAAETKQEHERFVESATATLAHAVRAGLALLEAKNRVDRNGWGRYLEHNVNVSLSVANGYMRIAAYRHQLPDSISPTAAKKLLSGLPALPKAHEFSEEARLEARRLFGEGVAVKKIAKELGTTSQTVTAWLDPKYVSKRRALTVQRAERRRAMQEALAEKERQQARKAAAKKAGGALAESYSHIRLHLEALDLAVNEATDPQVKAMLRQALGHAYKAEAKIVEALGVS